MKRRPLRELLIVLTVVAVGVTHFTEPATTESLSLVVKTSSGSEEPLQGAELWKFCYRQGQERIQEQEWDSARRVLELALETARDMPAGDRRLAETLDDLGLVYFQLGDYTRSARTQGQAVSALLLAAGPDDPDLKIFIQRYRWAAEKAGLQGLASQLQSPSDFLEIYPPELSALRRFGMGKVRTPQYDPRIPMIDR